jgi:hopanoid biosynthesis associated RND transporter like protein HpnN
VAGTVLVLAGLAALAAGQGLRIRPGYVDLLAPDSPVNARYVALLEDLGNVEGLYLVVGSDDDAAAGAFVDRIVPALLALRDEAGAPLVRDALGSVDLAWFRDRLPAFLPAGSLGPGGLLDAVDLESLAADPDPALLIATISDALAGAIERGEEVSGSDMTVAAIEAVVRELGRAAGGDERASLGRVLIEELGEDSRGKLDEGGRLRLGDGRHLVVVTPADERNDFNWLAHFLDEVQAAERRVLAELGNPEVGILHAGAPVLVVDEMDASRRDVTRSSIFALVLVSILFLASFHSVRHVGAAVAALLAGLGLTFGAALLLVGYLNLFSVVFAAVLIGLGIDFGIHVVNGYESARRTGRGVDDSLRGALTVVGPATTLGAITTSAAFFTTTISEFRGFSQLGLISGVGVLLCLGTAFTLLPALLKLFSRSDGPQQLQRPWSLRLLAWPVRHPRAAVAGMGALVVAAALSAPGLEFDYDLLNLQPEGTEAVALARGDGEDRIQTHQAFSMAASLQEAAARAAAFRALPSVASVSCAADLLPTDLEERRPGLESFASRLSPARGPRATPSTPDPLELRAALGELEELLYEAQDLAFDAGRVELVNAIEAAVTSTTEVAGSLGPESVDGLRAFGERTRAELAAMSFTAAEMAAGRGASPEDLPPALAARLVGTSGRLAVVVEPFAPVWDRPALEVFVADLRAIDPEVTGPPVQILEITEMMRRSYEQAAILAFGVIAIIVLVAQRSLYGTVLTLAPLLAGFVLTLGALRWLGVPLNPANLVALPLVLGIGVDNGIHVAHRWLKLRDARTAVFEVGHAIVVTSLTTMAGFTGLLIATHRGVRSLGAVAVVGTCAMLLCSVVLLPAALKLLERRPPEEPES